MNQERTWSISVALDFVVCCRASWYDSKVRGCLFFLAYVFSCFQIVRLYPIYSFRSFAARTSLPCSAPFRFSLLAVSIAVNCPGNLLYLLQTLLVWRWTTSRLVFEVCREKSSDWREGVDTVSGITKYTLADCFGIAGLAVGPRVPFRLKPNLMPQKMVRRHILNKLGKRDLKWITW